VVNTNLYLLKHRMEGDERERLHVIKKQMDYLNYLLESLLEMSRLDGSTDLTWGLVDMNGLAGDVIVNLQSRANEKGLALIFLPADLPLIQGDSQRLHLALTNVLQNALDYTSEGRVTLQTASEDGHVIVMVRDTGQGIPPEVQPRIFERFYRGDQARTSRGVGLGLAMVRKVAELHGGTIEVESQPGEGSTFRLILPVDCPAPMRPE
jgi:signal transduction histidine kinase